MALIEHISDPVGPARSVGRVRWATGVDPEHRPISRSVLTRPLVTMGSTISSPRPSRPIPRRGAYDDQRAAEYDEWYAGEGQYALRDRPGWAEDVDAVIAEVAGLPTARTLDVACGTGFLGRHLNGQVVGLDRSPSMVRIASGRVPGSRGVVGDALAFPFADRSFQRLVTGHFYGHCPRRSACFSGTGWAGCRSTGRDRLGGPGRGAAEGWQDRILNDGSRHRVYKRYFTGDSLAAEIGGRSLHRGPYFVMAAASLTSDRDDAA